MAGKGAINYKSVVKEVELETKNPFQAIFSKIFVGGRKLKPPIRKRQAVGLESESQSMLHVHVLKGTNLPLRREFIENYRQYLNNKTNYAQRDTQIRR